MSLHPGLAADIQTLAPTAIIELFELDCTSLGGSLLRFHAGTNQLATDIVWNGNTYLRFPVHVSGFETNGQGAFARPKLQVSNVLSAITTILLAYGDLLGAKLTRRRTLLKYLDAVNFTAGNVTADPTAEFPDDIYFIDRKSNEDRDTVEFELASGIDLIGITLPRRQIIQNVCVWKYRGSECGYTGPPLYDINDQLITAAPTVAGQNVINLWNAVVSAQSAVNNTQTALSAASQSKDTLCSYNKLDTEFNITYVPGPYSNTIAYVTYGVWVDVIAGTTKAFWNGTQVSLGSVYVQGALKATDIFSQSYYVYEIQMWGINSTNCTNATTTYNSALTAYNSAVTALATATTNYNTAYAALPSNDPTYGAEKCGKRLASCKLRFGASNSLPFGSFPSVGLIK